jgi:hypothetical protein
MATSCSFLETTGWFLGTSRSYPETSDSSPETDGWSLETSDWFPETSDSSSEMSGSFPSMDRSHAHNWGFSAGHWNSFPRNGTGFSHKN